MDVFKEGAEDCESAPGVFLDGDRDYDRLMVKRFEVFGAEFLGHGCI